MLLDFAYFTFTCGLTTPHSTIHTQRVVIGRQRQVDAAVDAAGMPRDNQPLVPFSALALHTSLSVPVRTPLTKSATARSMYFGPWQCSPAVSRYSQSAAPYLRMRRCLSLATGSYEPTSVIPSLPTARWCALTSRAPGPVAMEAVNAVLVTPHGRSPRFRCAASAEDHVRVAIIDLRQHPLGTLLPVEEIAEVEVVAAVIVEIAGARLHALQLADCAAVDQRARHAEGLAIAALMIKRQLDVVLKTARVHRLGVAPRVGQSAFAEDPLFTLPLPCRAPSSRTCSARCRC